MTSSDFAYWLQGFAELNGNPPTPPQWEMIKEHLGLVFNKVTTKSVPITTLNDGRLCKLETTYCASPNPMVGFALGDDTVGAGKVKTPRLFEPSFPESKDVLHSC
jgi:hypothetical protein